MDTQMDKQIDTRLIYGFLESGKTTYIQDCIVHDFFHKYGTTLILCFEEGEESYDEELLSSFRTSVAFYEEDEDVTSFCLRMIDRFQPERIYVEMNIMMDDLAGKLPEVMKPTFTLTLFDWSTLELYLSNLKQHVSTMVSASNQVIFLGCPSKEDLAPFSQEFRVMNRTASYLRRDPMGYHEKAFDLFVPYPLDTPELEISENEYIPFWLDAQDHPEHYEGKRIRFTDPLEVRRDAPMPGCNAGRVVMTCCMADLQYMGFGIIIQDEAPGKWILLDSAAIVETDIYRRRHVKLRLLSITAAPAPEELILNAGLRQS